MHWQDAINLSKEKKAVRITESKERRKPFHVYLMFEDGRCLKSHGPDGLVIDRPDDREWRGLNDWYPLEFFDNKKINNWNK